MSSTVVNKNFRVKNGLIVEGTTGTINGNNILTESAGDSYILNLVGGATLVKSVDSSVFTVDGSGNLTVNSNVFDAYGAASAAQTAANSYTDSAISSLSSTLSSQSSTDISNAITTAENYTDSAISSEVSRANGAYDVLGAASSAQSAAESYADTAATNAQSSAESYADTAATNAENAAKSYADTVAGTAQSNAEAYTDTAVANLVNGAPSTLDTLKKIDDAINNDATFSATLLSDITNAITTSESYTNTAISNLSTVYDSSGSAATAQSNAESYTDAQIAAGNSTATPTYEALNVNSISLVASAKVSVPSAGTATA